MSWNLLYNNPRPDAIPPFLAQQQADVIALQELTDDLVTRIGGDLTLKQEYPHRRLWSYGRGGGMGLLSRYPIMASGDHRRPPTLWARLDLGQNGTVVVVNTHPTFFPQRPVDYESDEQTGLWRKLRHLLTTRIFGYDPSFRDEGIATVRELVAPMLRRGDALLLVGDFNVTEREPGYRELTAQLQDAHRLVGCGLGHTWRPGLLSRLPIAVLRIDYMLASPGVRPLCMSVDRTPRGSDHCPIYGEFELVTSGNSQ